MSLEHIISGIEGVRAPMAEIERHSGLSWAARHDAAPAALNKFGARRIGLLTPFEKAGNESAARMFEDLGFTVVASVGLSCAHALHIAHIPDWAKEKAITELLASADNKLHAIVQCGTNMSLIDVCERTRARRRNSDPRHQCNDLPVCAPGERVYEPAGRRRQAPARALTEGRSVR